MTSAQNSPDQFVSALSDCESVLSDNKHGDHHDGVPLLLVGAVALGDHHPHHHRGEAGPGGGCDCKTATGSS